MTSHGEKPKKAKTTKTKSSTSTKDINYATQQNSLCGNRAVYGCLLLHDGLGTLRVGFHARTAYHHCYIRIFPMYREPLPQPGPLQFQGLLQCTLTLIPLMV